MSKILLFTDVHWSSTSSIVRQISTKYSLRLERLINSMNWVNSLANEQEVDFMICAGDFMDKSHCTDMELSALREINWADKDCYFLVGNHESSVNDLVFSSVKAVESEKHFIIDKPRQINNETTQIHFVPYIVESDRKDLITYLSDVDKIKKQIIISHNEILGMQYGAVESKTGFGIQEIEENCDLYLNGHLHNSDWVGKKILNLGSLSAHNFTNNALKYRHGAWVLDTDTLQLTFFENPYAFNFLSTTVKTVDELKTIYNEVEKMNNLVLSIKCPAKISNEIKTYIDSLTNVITARITNEYDMGETIGSESIETDLSKIDDHIEKFKYFILDAVGNTDLVIAELAEICK